MAEPKSGSLPELVPTPPAEGGIMPIEEFTALASKLVGFSMYKEAIGLYETAVKLHPNNLAIKINLARVRDMKRRSDERLLKDLDDSIQEKREREDRLANHALGLGTLHYRKGEIDRARELFTLARESSPNLFTTNLMLGRVSLGRGEFDQAIACLEDARRANPFSEEVASLLGRLYMEKGDHTKAMQALLDALLLSPEPDLARQPFYRLHVAELLRRLGYGDADLPALLHDRQVKLQQLTDRIERIRRERAAAKTSTRLGSIFAQITSAAAKPTNEALALRRFLLLERAGDDDLRILHRALHREEYPDGAVVLQAGDHTGKLYLVDKGRVRVRRTTPFGEVVLAGYAAGECFGEMAFLDGRGHSADAIAEGDTAILTLARDEALRIFATRKALSVHCLSFFWHSLAEHIRNTNDQMKTFFVQESMAASRADPRTRARGESVSVDLGEKMALLEEKGLSAGELQILATLSTEERYAAADLIFAEGDHGTKLYIVLDGKVRISKLIPGVGEEALAILERGDFFGEMALVDDKPRSADARAHEAGTVVLAIDKRVLDDILAHDLKSAEQFLSIVCRILCQRLREINETIVKWRMLSGGF